MGSRNRRSSDARRAPAAPGPGSLRVIGGEWRGRRIPVPDLPGLRPTADRIRETLFNWLLGELADARCLDLFAGSGALGIEALSRGAAHCDFVEAQAAAAASLRRCLETLGGSDRASVEARDALAWLDTAAAGYDIVFLDPPFDSALLDAALASLVRGRALTPGALVYVEYAPSMPPQLPEGLALLRSRRTPAVVYELYRRADATGGEADL